MVWEKWWWPAHRLEGEAFRDTRPDPRPEKTLIESKEEISVFIYETRIIKYDMNSYEMFILAF